MYAEEGTYREKAGHDADCRELGNCLDKQYKQADKGGLLQSKRMSFGFLGR